ncbi:caspase domain-containing protein [Bradyrhizobium sp.]|uniref:caspase family protein n=1 Tax=Bradyrhizobium sp. TaxID=376 RepID=UPI002635840A|nr:caspase domain-containing protein [Bradyrhizobium sp.]
MAAAQQPQEKRVALVIGNGAYAKSPLATTANDAGLVAQNLQAAGFDVIGARDLDADSLRKTFRDFMQKVEVDPANTVAMVYLAGYGVQLAGENYFIPVDATINRDTDIPIEGLRISDYTRELASVPLKASIFVLDAAREQPFVEGGNPIASGLALVDPQPNMLIAFNAAPGTVAPTEPGPYGAYAQALAEMIRTGGLTLPEVFDRVRLRVSENTKGGQIPWDAQKIQVQFTFFDRAPDAPPVQGAPDQVAAIRDRPMRDLGAQEAFTAALTRDTMQGYEDFLVAYPRDPLSKRVRAILAARREAITWRRTYLADTPDAYWSYLRRYPHGPHAWDARRRLSILSAALEPPPTFEMIDYDLPPPPPDEYVYVDRPVFYFGDPEFDFAPPPPPPVFFLPPPPPDFVVLPPPFAPVGLFILPQPVFVPVPVYVSAPAYVAPPQNNIIFNIIHNTTIINNTINVAPPVPNNITTAAISGKTGAAPLVSKSLRIKAEAINKDPSLIPASTLVNTNAKTSTKQVFPVSRASTATTTNPPPQTDIKQGTAVQQGGTGTKTGTQSQQETVIQPGTRQLETIQQGTKQQETTQQGNKQQETTKPSDHALPTNLPPNGKGNEASKGGTSPVLGKPSGTQAPTNPALQEHEKALQDRKGASDHALPTNLPPIGKGNEASKGGTSPVLGKPSGTQAPTNPALQEHERALQDRKGASQPTTTTRAKPEGKSITPPPPPPPPSRPEARRVAPPPPRQEVKRFTPPPPHVSAPPPPRMAAPPPPRMAAPPPPRMAAPPPPRMVAPPPRMAAPPPPRVAAPPPPRMSAPPPRPAPPPPAKPAPAKKCPPNQPKC